MEKQARKLNEKLPIIKSDSFFKEVIKDIRFNIEKGLNNCFKLQDFIENGCINHITSYGNCLLSLYIKTDNSNIEVVDFLLKNGANIKRRNQYGECVICQSIKTKKDFNFIKQLFKRGAYINSEIDYKGENNLVLKSLIEKNPVYQKIYVLNNEVKKQQSHYLPFEKKSGYDIDGLITYVENNIKEHGINDCWTSNIDWFFINFENTNVEYYNNIFISILDRIKHKQANLTGDQVVDLAFLGNVNQQNIFGKNLAMIILSNNIPDHYYVSQPKMEKLLKRTNLNQKNQNGQNVLSCIISAQSDFNFSQFDFSVDTIRNYISRTDINAFNADGLCLATQIIICNDSLRLEKNDYFDIVKRFDFFLDVENDFIINSIQFKNRFNLDYDDLLGVFSNNQELLESKKLDSILHGCMANIETRETDLDFLLSLGADINSKDNKGKTLLMKVLENKEKYHLLNFLIQIKPDMNIVDDYNKNAWDYALEYFPDFELLYNVENYYNKKKIKKQIL